MTETTIPSSSGAGRSVPPTPPQGSVRSPGEVGEVGLDLTGDHVVLDLRDRPGSNAGAPLSPPGAAAPARPGRRVPPWATALGVAALVGWSLWAGTVGAVLVVVGVLASVAIHELAHLLVARRVGVASQEFFVGFGPRLWSTHRGGTEWGVKLVPAGGYVKLVDEHDAAPWRKAAIAVAGPAANLAVALFLLVAVSAGGLLPTATGTTSDQSILGRVATGIDRTGDSVVAAADAVWSLPASVAGMGGAVAMGRDVPADEERLISPVGIGRMADQASAAGWEVAVLLVAVVNLALAVFNLVPLPPLDGGRVVAAAGESILSRLRRRRVVLTGKGFERVGIAVVGILLFAGLAAVVLDLVHPLADPFGG